MTRTRFYVLLLSLSLLRCQLRGEVLTRVDATGSSTSEGSAGQGGGGASATVPVFAGNIESLATGDAHTCFVSRGALYCFGDGKEGALGSSSLNDQLVPVPIALSGTAHAVSAGARNTCVLLSSGRVFCAGAGNSGQLGRGTFESSDTFVEVPLPKAARAVDVGSDHVCAILATNELYCWGSNAEGQLAQEDPFPDPGTPRPSPIAVDPSSRYSSISLGQGHSCGIRADGALYCWGRNTENQLGQGDAAPDQTRTPQRVGALNDYLRVRAGQGHTCAIHSGGSLECWGDGSNGQLGLGDRTSRDFPTSVGDTTFDSLDLDTFTTCAGSNGTIDCAGRGTEGQLGMGNQDHLALTALSIEGVVLFAVGRFHTCAATAKGLFCTGSNDDGQLGVGDRERRYEFSGVLAAR